MEKQHDFDTSYATGILGEEFLDSIFAEKFTIETVNRDDQRRGIDRYFTGKSGNRFGVEYKTDTRAADTGNAFIETVSVDTTDRAGWAYKSESKYLVYYVPNLELIYCMKLSAIRDQLARWAATYPTRPAHNRTYDTYGILVPLAELAAVSEWIVQC